jgi:DNA-binding CsgD family transcriptional regulator
MTDIHKNQIAAAYFELLNQHTLDAGDLDYSILDKQIPLLQGLATIGNSGISVFDYFRKEHVFYSDNFGTLLGYDLSEIKDKGHDYWDAKIHPEDFITLMLNGISQLKLFFQFSPDEKINYKLVNEYRMLNTENNYVRVIEQHQVLALDNAGNMWLSLSIIDISPNQELNEEIKSQLLNFRTGKIIPLEKEVKNSKPLNIALSQREIQILKMVKDGLLSKEISDKLNISLHTVNTHRQRFLGKLSANNSMEAVVFASRLGLL